MVGRRVEQEEPEPAHPVIIVIQSLLLLGGVFLVWGILKMAERESKK